MIKFIWIIGNLTSGKSTLCKSLKESLPAYTHLDVDTYRKKINKRNTMKGEIKALNSFLDDLYASEMTLLESIGTYGMDKMEGLLLPEECLIIRLDISKKVATKRLRSRVRNKSEQVPFPYIKKTSLKSYINSWVRFNPWLKNNPRDLKIDYSLNTSNLSRDQVLSRVTKFLKKKNVIDSK